MGTEHVVVRDPLEVMFVAVTDQHSEIQQAWASFEDKVGLRGRKVYGAFDPVSRIYKVCAVLRPVMNRPSSAPSTARFPVGGTSAFGFMASHRGFTRRSGRRRSDSHSVPTPTRPGQRSSTTAATT